MSIKLKLQKSISRGSADLKRHIPSIYLDISNTIVFTNLPSRGNKKLKDVTLTHLPFDDITVVVATEISDAVTDDIIEPNGDPLLLRMVRDRYGVRIYLYTQPHKTGDFSIFSVMNVVGNDIVVDEKFSKMMARIRGNVKLSNDLDTFNGELLSIACELVPKVLWSLTRHEMKVVNDPRKALLRKGKIPRSQLEGYIEYTVDLDKPKRYNSRALGGTHASPHEHMRRGHYRTLRNGNRIWINAIKVNEGNNPNLTVDKDYTFNNTNKGE